MKALVWRGETKLGEDYAIEDIPADLQEKAEQYRHELVERVAESDDTLMEKYLEGEELTVAELKAGIRALTIAGEVNPVLCGTAFKNKGVQPMLDAVLDYLPSPLDVPPTEGHRPGKEEEVVVRHADAEEPFSALAFKIATHPFFGKLTYIRVYSGHVAAGSPVVNSTKGKQGAHRQAVPDALQQGEPGRRGVGGPHLRDDRPQGHHHRRHPVRPGGPGRPRVDDLPRAGHLGGHRAQDQGRPGEARRTRSRSWPRRTRRSRSTRTRRPARRSSPGWASSTSTSSSTGCVASSRSRPTSASRRWPTGRRSVARSRSSTTPTRSRPVGRASTPRCRSRIEPLDTHEGELYEFENKVTGGRIPREYIPSVDQGIQDAMQYGVLAGYPLVGIKATLLDGAYHDVDSSEMAFKIAGSMVLKDAVRKADPVLLEPMMAVEVRTPEEYMGDVIGDINTRRGQIQAMEDISGAKVVKGLVPLSEMFGYVGDLRSKTQGRANYSMQFDSYAEVPRNVAEEIIKKIRGE